ncbi:putative high affinity cAMP phosphodiesterase [Thermoascus aurantiacus ATCC 26904]
MDGADCCAVYIDDRVKSERWVRRNSSDSAASTANSFILADEPEALQGNVELLLEVCKQIYLCHTAKSFAGKLAELNEQSDGGCNPIFAFFDVGFSEESASARRRASRNSGGEFGAAPPSPLARRGLAFSSESQESYGLQLLSQVSSDIQVQDGPKLIVPVAILRPPDSCASSPRMGSAQLPLILKPFASSGDPASSPAGQQGGDAALSEPKQIARCLDAGAVDVLTSPLERARVHGLMVHAYRTRRAAQKELSGFLAGRKLRKQSWVGVNDDRPYAYLREAMVSKLMKGICNPEETIDEFQDRGLYILEERRSLVEREIGNWCFSAHDFSDDELVYGACLMLAHALSMPELQPWRLSPGELRTFMLASRAAYNSFVLYHNFRHAVDVLQSVFCFLLHIGVLPPYFSHTQPVTKSPIASLLTPFDALTLLIAAIGHDVGHPGVNNVFLVKLNAPLAQLYNDNSVLEAFHCAAFSQILRRHWPSAFEDRNLRKLLISTILATDMGVHHKFMESLGELQEKYHANSEVDDWKPQDKELYRTLMCGLLIKCADISNVARPWQIAQKWTNILQQEFANQGEMEKEVGMETALFGGPPELGNVLQLATGQIGFMSIFALPLFEGVCDLLPQMIYTVRQIKYNQSVWQRLADEHKRKDSLHPGAFPDITYSPRSHSPVGEPSQIDGPGDPSAQQQDDVRPTLSPRSSLESIPLIAQNGDSVGQGHSTGITPSLEALRAALISDTSSRRSSSAVPGVPATPTHAGCREPDASNDSEISGTDDMSRSPQDPPVHATTPFTDSSQSGHDAQAAPASNRRPTETAPEHPCSSHHGHHHHGHRSHDRCSSGLASVASTSHRNSRGTRTQSGSTQSNTLPTPLSPSTNSTGFLSVDSADEKEGFYSRLRRKSEGNVVSADSSSRPTPRPASRPASAGMYTIISREHCGDHHRGSYFSRHHHQRSPRRVDDCGKDHIMTTVVGNDVTSRAASAVTGGGMKTGGNGNGGEPFGSSEPMPRTVPRRKSRLRLAFWRRKHPHHEEVSGES